MTEINIADKILEDLKKLFRFAVPNKLTPCRTLFIPENKFELFRYIVDKNLKED